MKPNILFLFPDQHRYDWLPGRSGLPLRMPQLAGVMARGMTFRNAVTPSPICAPARACVASGKSYEECGVPDNTVDYPLHQETYYQRLRSLGYQVSGVGKFDLHKATMDWGTDGTRLLDEWGFTRGIDNEGKFDAIASGSDRPRGPYMAFLEREGLRHAHIADFAGRKGTVNSYIASNTTPLPQRAYCDDWIASNALAELEDFEVDRPWHLVVNFTGPHNPMDVTDAMDAEWPDADFPPPVDNDQYDGATHRMIRRRYAAMLQNIDRHIGRMLDVIRARGESDRTLVVYSSDHGEMLGDHGRWAKSTFYQPSIGVPLVIAGPGVRAGVDSDALVSLQDITATFLEGAGSDPLPGMDGRSLWPVLTGQRAGHRRRVMSGLGRWRCVFDGRWKYVRGIPEDPTGVRLFDLRSDPHEREDLAESHPDELRRLADALIAPPFEPAAHTAASGQR